MTSVTDAEVYQQWAVSGMQQCSSMNPGGPRLTCRGLLVWCHNEFTDFLLLETACNLCKCTNPSIFWALRATSYIQDWIIAVVLLVDFCQSPVLSNFCDWCRRNIEDMLRIHWHVAVFDEAHKLKNRNAKIHEACCRLGTKLRYGLTGTAMQVPISTSC